ncbi:uncharacterized protein LOC125487055 [Rhincodon typus]|uniref:uncharacterized protein LOC125487055 n=1 Tax=Rhincodon typus TaxID=259920 RepID=UPI00202E35F8|nr:uncharacterized protein LOC125487055 [Rhincodon typus]XP_048472947.1 uncharacterized protein LOC125487055 [Rhincodon typus]
MMLLGLLCSSSPAPCCLGFTSICSSYYLRYHIYSTSRCCVGATLEDAEAPAFTTTGCGFSSEFLQVGIFNRRLLKQANMSREEQSIVVTQTQREGDSGQRSQISPYNSTLQKTTVGNANEDFHGVTVSVDTPCDVLQPEARVRCISALVPSRVAASEPGLHRSTRSQDPMPSVEGGVAPVQRVHLQMQKRPASLAVGMEHVAGDPGDSITG